MDILLLIVIPIFTIILYFIIAIILYNKTNKIKSELIKENEYLKSENERLSIITPDVFNQLLQSLDYVDNTISELMSIYIYNSLKKINIFKPNGDKLINDKDMEEIANLIFIDITERYSESFWNVITIYIDEDKLEEYIMDRIIALLIPIVRKLNSEESILNQRLSDKRVRAKIKKTKKE